ncbi:hypothetical protein, partial [Pseudomonas lundensis]
DWCPVILPNQEVFFRVSLGVCDFCILIKAIDKGLEVFLSNGNPLPPTDPVYNDFHSALKNLRLAVAACERG